MSTRAWHPESGELLFTDRERWGKHFGPEDEFLQLRAGDTRRVSAGGGGLDGGCAASLAHGDGGILDQADLGFGRCGDANRLRWNRRRAALGFGFALDWLRPSIGFRSKRFCTRSAGGQWPLGILWGTRLRVLLHQRPRGLLRE